MASRPIGAVAIDAFASPMTDKSRLPLRIAVYNKIAEAIRTGVLLPSQLLPPEAELGSGFLVSRTVMREALILLEEDGLIRTQRGIGRFIVDVLPRVGIEELRPIEQILSLPVGRVEVRRMRAEREESTEFTRRGLGLGDHASALIWESLLMRDGQKIALVQEWVPGDGTDSALTTEVLDLLTPHTNDEMSMLSVLIDGLEMKPGPGSCDVSVSNAGAHRAQVLSVTDASSVLLLSQTVAYNGAPLFVAKYIIRPDVAHLTIVQS